MLTIHVGHSSVVDADQRIYPCPRSRLPRSTNPPRFAASTSLASWPLPRTNKNKTKQTFGKLGRNSAPELPSRTPAGTCRPFPNPFLFLANGCSEERERDKPCGFLPNRFWCSTEAHAVHYYCTHHHHHHWSAWGVVVVCFGDDGRVVLPVVMLPTSSHTSQDIIDRRGAGPLIDGQFCKWWRVVAAGIYIEGLWLGWVKLEVFGGFGVFCAVCVREFVVVACGGENLGVWGVGLTWNSIGGLDRLVSAIPEGMQLVLVY